MDNFCRLLIALCVADVLSADEFVLRRCEVTPVADRQVILTIDGAEKLRWHSGSQYPRPFFYPFNGPSGVSLTRMGHPGAPDHDHHRSIWFASHKVNGIDFWSDNTEATIRQKQWYRYRNGDDEAVMALCLGWYDEHGVEIMEQDVVAALRPLPNHEHTLELQSTFRPPKGVESVSLDRTNFGLLAVRVASGLSARFGGGQLISSEGAVGEKEVFGQRARWMDCSGLVAVGVGPNRRTVREGITVFDHPDNLRYPTHWHVRADGWMGASFGMHADHRIQSGDSLVLRYLLHVHAGDYDAERAAVVHRNFAGRPGFRIFRPGTRLPHLQYEVERIGNPD